MRALVTGGAGFIGSNLVDGLVARDHEVTVLDDLSTGKHENLHPAMAAGAELIEADVRDPSAVGDVVDRAEPEVIGWSWSKHFINVLLPAPLGPSSPIAPGATCRLMPSRAFCAP